MKIAVVGATGLSGQPVTRKLRAEGHDIVVCSRSPERARAIFGLDYEYRRIVPEGMPTVPAALEGCEAVHINTGTRNEEEAERVLWRGNENIAKVARELGMQRISMIASNFDPDPNHEWARRRYFSRGVLAVKNSGVPYMIFGCTCFQESLPQFIQNGRATIVGKQPLLWHWVNTQDYARMVAQAYRLTESLNRHFVIHGPEPFTMYDALKQYCSALCPEVSIHQYPAWQVKLLAKYLNKPHLLELVRNMEKFEVYGESGDPHDTDMLLGTPMITLREWVLQIARERVHSK